MEPNPFLRRVLATYNSRRPEAFDALLTEDCTLVRDGAEARGREAVKRVLGQLYRAIPDLEYRIDDAVSEGAKTAIRWEGHGTHRGEYQGVAPTGDELSYSGITIYEQRGGLIARIWVSTNLVERLRKASELTPRMEPHVGALP
ncbi:MAG TPA: ester cyclase [Polyangia bacterium]|jgi:steroid delta-isomerase-like uncharacterized protein|nr:ester cyclase [Polyangia bacterium]